MTSYIFSANLIHKSKLLTYTTSKFKATPTTDQHALLTIRIILALVFLPENTIPARKTSKAFLLYHLFSLSCCLRLE